VGIVEGIGLSARWMSFGRGASCSDAHSSEARRENCALKLVCWRVEFGRLFACTQRFPVLSSLSHCL
jgi:hypothetical protein